MSESKEVFEVHFSSADAMSNIDVYQIESREKLTAFLISELTENKVVYLVSIFDEEYVCDHAYNVLIFINAFLKDPIYEYTGEKIQIFLYEYYSFEEAYKDALHMNEPNPLCYMDSE